MVYLYSIFNFTFFESINLPSWLIILIGCHLLFSFFTAKFFYNRIIRYFSLKDIQASKESKIQILNNDEINCLEDNNPEYKRKDFSRLSFTRFLFGAIFLFLPRVIYLIFTLILIIFFMSISSCFNNNFSFNRNISKIRWWTNYIILITLSTPAYFLFGIIASFKKKRDKKTEEIFKKYLGTNYDINQDRPYSCLISNHLGWIECFVYTFRVVCGFVAKSELMKVPLISNVMFNLDCLFLNRASKDDRDNIAEMLKVRQKSFMDGKTSTPLLVYPEGSYTNGKYIMKFKKGVFAALLPIKPIWIEIDEFNSSIPETPFELPDHIFYTFTILWQFITFWEFPIVEYTKHMSTLKLENESDSDCYCRIVQNIYLEIGNLKLSEKGTRELIEFERLARLRKYE